MLVSHRHKFIYTKTFKTAGTSVESYFEPFCMNDGEWSMCHPRDQYISNAGIIGQRGSRPADCIWWSHMPARLIRRRIGREIWNTYFKFCVIRNPYDRLISAFHFKKKMGSITVNPLHDDRRQFELWIESNQFPRDRGQYTLKKKFCLDDVIRYERLVTDIERICVRLGIPWNPSSIPHFNPSKRRKDLNLRVGDYYTEKTRKIVADVFAYEIDFFGYSFPEK